MAHRKDVCTTSADTLGVPQGSLPPLVGISEWRHRQGKMEAEAWLPDELFPAGSTCSEPTSHSPSISATSLTFEDTLRRWHSARADALSCLATSDLRYGKNHGDLRTKTSHERTRKFEPLDSSTVFLVEGEMSICSDNLLPKTEDTINPEFADFQNKTLEQIFSKISISKQTFLDTANIRQEDTSIVDKSSRHFQEGTGNVKEKEIMDEKNIYKVKELWLYETEDLQDENDIHLKKLKQELCPHESKKMWSDAVKIVVQRGLSEETKCCLSKNFLCDKENDMESEIESETLHRLQEAILVFIKKNKEMSQHIKAHHEERPIIYQSAETSEGCLIDEHSGLFEKYSDVNINVIDQTENSKTEDDKLEVETWGINDSTHTLDNMTYTLSRTEVSEKGESDGGTSSELPEYLNDTESNANLRELLEESLDEGFRGIRCCTIRGKDFFREDSEPKDVGACDESIIAKCDEISEPSEPSEPSVNPSERETILPHEAQSHAPSEKARAVASKCSLLVVRRAKRKRRRFASDRKYQGLPLVFTTSATLQIRRCCLHAQRTSRSSIQKKSPASPKKRITGSARTSVASRGNDGGSSAEQQGRPRLPRRHEPAASAASALAARSCCRARSPPDGTSAATTAFLDSRLPRVGGTAPVRAATGRGRAASARLRPTAPAPSSRLLHCNHQTAALTATVRAAKAEHAVGGGTVMTVCTATTGIKSNVRQPTTVAHPLRGGIGRRPSVGHRPNASSAATRSTSPSGQGRTPSRRPGALNAPAILPPNATSTNGEFANNTFQDDLSSQTYAPPRATPSGLAATLPIDILEECSTPTPRRGGGAKVYSKGPIAFGRAAPLSVRAPPRQSTASALPRINRGSTVVTRIFPPPGRGVRAAFGAGTASSGGKAGPRRNTDAPRKDSAAKGDTALTSQPSYVSPTPSQAAGDASSLTSNTSSSQTSPPMSTPLVSGKHRSVATLWRSPTPVTATPVPPTAPAALARVASPSRNSQLTTSLLSKSKLAINERPRSPVIPISTDTASRLSASTQTSLAMSSLSLRRHMPMTSPVMTQTSLISSSSSSTLSTVRHDHKHKRPSTAKVPCFSADADAISMGFRKTNFSPPLMPTAREIPGSDALSTNVTGEGSLLTTSSPPLSSSTPQSSLTQSKKLSPRTSTFTTAASNTDSIATAATETVLPVLDEVASVTSPPPPPPTPSFLASPSTFSGLSSGPSEPISNQFGQKATLQSLIPSLTKKSQQSNLNVELNITAPTESETGVALVTSENNRPTPSTKECMVNSSTPGRVYLVSYSPPWGRGRLGNLRPGGSTQKQLPQRRRVVLAERIESANLPRESEPSSDPSRSSVACPVASATRPVCMDLSSTTGSGKTLNKSSGSSELRKYVFKANRPPTLVASRKSLHRRLSAKSSAFKNLVRLNRKKAGPQNSDCTNMSTENTNTITSISNYSTNEISQIHCTGVRSKSPTKPHVPTMNVKLAQPPQTAPTPQSSPAGQNFAINHAAAAAAAAVAVAVLQDACRTASNNDVTASPDRARTITQRQHPLGDCQRGPRPVSASSSEDVSLGPRIMIQPRRLASAPADFALPQIHTPTRNDVNPKVLSDPVVAKLANKFATDIHFPFPLRRKMTHRSPPPSPAFSPTLVQSHKHTVLPGQCLVSKPPSQPRCHTANTVTALPMPPLAHPSKPPFIPPAPSTLLLPFKVTPPTVVSLPPVTPTASPPTTQSEAPSDTQSVSPSAPLSVTPFVSPIISSLITPSTPSATQSTNISVPPSLNPTVAPLINPSFVPTINPLVIPPIIPSVMSSATTPLKQRRALSPAPQSVLLCEPCHPLSVNSSTLSDRPKKSPNFMEPQLTDPSWAQLEPQTEALHLLEQSNDRACFRGRRVPREMSEVVELREWASPRRRRSPVTATPGVVATAAGTGTGGVRPRKRRACHSSSDELHDQAPLAVYQTPQPQQLSQASGDASLSVQLKADPGSPTTQPCIPNSKGQGLLKPPFSSPFIPKPPFYVEEPSSSQAPTALTPSTRASPTQHPPLQVSEVTDMSADVTNGVMPALEVLWSRRVRQRAAADRYGPSMYSPWRWRMGKVLGTGTPWTAEHVAQLGGTHTPFALDGAPAPVPAPVPVPVSVPDPAYRPAFAYAPAPHTRPLRGAYPRAHAHGKAPPAASAEHRAAAERTAAPRRSRYGKTQAYCVGRNSRGRQEAVRQQGVPRQQGAPWGEDAAFENIEREEEWREAEASYEGQRLEDRSRSFCKDSARRGERHAALVRREEEEEQQLSRTERVRQRLRHYLRTHWARGDAGMSGMSTVTPSTSRTDGAGDAVAVAYGKRARLTSAPSLRPSPPARSATPSALQAEGAAATVASTSALATYRNLKHVSSTMKTSPPNLQLAHETSGHSKDLRASKGEVSRGSREAVSTASRSSEVSVVPATSAAFAATADTGQTVTLSQFAESASEQVDSSTSTAEVTMAKPVMKESSNPEDSYAPWLELLLPRSLGRASLPPSPPPSPLPDDPFAQDPCAPGPLTCDPVFLAQGCRRTEAQGTGISDTSSSNRSSASWTQPIRTQTNEYPPSGHSSCSEQTSATAATSSPQPPPPPPPPLLSSSNIEREHQAPEEHPSRPKTKEKEQREKLATAGASARNQEGLIPTPEQSESSEYTTASETLGSPTCSSTGTQALPFPQPAPNSSVLQVSDKIRIVKKSESRSVGTDDAAYAPNTYDNASPPTSIVYFTDTIRVVRRQNNRRESSTSPSRSPHAKPGAHDTEVTASPPPPHLPPPPTQLPPPPPALFADCAPNLTCEQSCNESWPWKNRACDRSCTGINSHVAYWTFDELGRPSPYVVAEAVCGAPPSPYYSSPPRRLPSRGTSVAAMDPGTLPVDRSERHRGTDGDRQRRRPFSPLRNRTLRSPARQPVLYERMMSGEPSGTRDTSDLRLIPQRG